MKAKESVLALLEQSRGQSVSGEYIAQTLFISRNAVWKAVDALRREGYRIEAVTNKGYRLCEENDILSEQGIRPHLSPENKHIPIFVFSELVSTNQTAKEMAVSGAQHGTVVIADSQTAGKGRYSRRFYSPPGCGLYISFILDPARLCFETPTMVTAFAGVAVCKAVRAVIGIEPKIKWVNDLFLNKKKICGILTEAVTSFESGTVQWIVTGIGINVSARSEDFPEDVRTVAGSLFPDGVPAVTRNQLAAGIISRMLSADTQWESVLDEYRKRLYMLGERVTVASAKGSYEAVAVDVDETGRLIVRTDAGDVQVLSSGEISIRQP